MNSPIKNAPFKIIEYLDVDLIKSLYKENCNLNVSKYYEGVDVLELRECGITRLKYYYPDNTIGDEEFYKNFSSLSDYSRKWEYDHKFAYEKINENDFVLEIGCGSGNFLEKIKDKNANSTGIELNPNMVEVCKSKGLNVVNESIENFALENKNKFNVVCMFQVLEHVFYVEDFIRNSMECLKPGGKLIISTPNNSPYYARYNKYETLNLPPHHVTLWNLESFDLFANYMGLDLKSSELSEMVSFKGEVYYKAQDLNNYRKQNSIINYFNLFRAIPIVLLNRLKLGKTSNFIVVEMKKL